MAALDPTSLLLDRVDAALLASKERRAADDDEMNSKPPFATDDDDDDEMNSIPPFAAITPPGPVPVPPGPPPLPPPPPPAAAAAADNDNDNEYYEHLLERVDGILATSTADTTSASSLPNTVDVAVEFDGRENLGVGLCISDSRVFSAQIQDLPNNIDGSKGQAERYNTTAPEERQITPGMLLVSINGDALDDISWATTMTRVSSAVGLARNALAPETSRITLCFRVEQEEQGAANPSGINQFALIRAGMLLTLLEYETSGRLTADDLLQVDEKGRTMLATAAMHGKRDIVEWLLLRGAETTITDKDGRSAMHFACGKNGTLEIAKCLLDARKKAEASGGSSGGSEEEGSDVNQHTEEHLCLVNGADHAGNTPLHLASFHGHTATCEWLLENSAQPFRKNRTGRTSLHQCAFGGHVPIVKLLLIQPGANLCATDANGWNPLHFAAARGNHRTVRCLYCAGSQVELRNSDGNTAADIAVQPETASFLKRVARTPDPPSAPRLLDRSASSLTVAWETDVEQVPKILSYQCQWAESAWNSSWRTAVDNIDGSSTAFCLAPSPTPSGASQAPNSAKAAVALTAATLVKRARTLSKSLEGMTTRERSSSSASSSKNGDDGSDGDEVANPGDEDSSSQQMMSGLRSGASFVLRLRCRNENGWSRWSHTSPAMTTCSADASRTNAASSVSQLVAEDTCTPLSTSQTRGFLVLSAETVRDVPSFPQIASSHRSCFLTVQLGATRLRSVPSAIDLGEQVFVFADAFSFIVSETLSAGLLSATLCMAHPRSDDVVLGSAVIPVSEICTAENGRKSLALHHDGRPSGELQLHCSFECA